MTTQTDRNGRVVAVLAPDTMTLDSALRYAVGTDWHPAVWRLAEWAIVAARLCPSCACHGQRGLLGDWQPGNSEEHAGRECWECGEFVVCGVQPEYESQADEWRGDADPGL